MIENINVREVASRCLRDEAEAITQVIDQLDDSFERVVELILGCKGKVIVTGVGKSGHVGAKIAATLASTGTPAFYLNPLDAFHGDLGMIAATDIVVALSNSGQTDELLRFVPFLKDHHIPLVGISGNADSLLARNSDIHILLHVAHEACPLNLAPTSSTTVQLAFGDALAVALMQVRHFEASDFAQFHPGGTLGKRLLSTARDVMRSEELPTIAPTMTLAEAILIVSRGMMGMAVAMEGDRIAGIITDGDVRRAMERMHQDFYNIRVEEVMTPNPKCVGLNTKLTEIQKILHVNNIHAVLVTDEQRHLLGIVESLSCMI
ncbi:MAG: KpsF/GutQ family sugar-phosphate isomerase [Bacteroidales bacterium]|nr:KpsF/GutQ family sugar-phosphate isomerase [Bacteroidales bacterium]